MAKTQLISESEQRWRESVAAFNRGEFVVVDGIFQRAVVRGLKTSSYYDADGRKTVHRVKTLEGWRDLGDDVLHVFTNVSDATNFLRRTPQKQAA